MLRCRRCALRTYMALSASSSARPASACGPRIATPADAPAVTVRPRKTKVSRSIACSSDAALALASVSLRFHNSSANSSPPSRPITSEERTWLEQRRDDGLQHLIARGMPEGVVDRLQAIDVEHDQRAAGMIALDVGDRAMELALKAAPVRNIQQEVGIGGGLQFLDSRLRLGQLGLEPANRRFGVAGRPPAAAGSRPPGVRRGAAFRPAAAGFAAFCSPGGGRPGFLLHGLPCAGLLMKACRDSPRQDSPFRTPCHALDEPRADPIIRPMFLDSRTELTT